MFKRSTPEEVHADGGHAHRSVLSCPLCQHNTAPELEVVDARDAGGNAGPFHTTEAPVLEGVRTTQAGCAICGRPVHHRGLCGAHYQTRRGATAKEDKRG